MGVLNVTSDSFFDGGRFLSPDTAIAHGLSMRDLGADVVDVGGESSRPGAHGVDETEELSRVIPAVEALAALGTVSVDTVKATVARRAVAAGASIINDVSGTLWPVAAECGVGWVAMHRQGTPETMQLDPHYDDVVREVHDHILGLATEATRAGVPDVWVDPGIGFGKTSVHNLALLRHVGDLVKRARMLGVRVMIGTSNKRFLGLVASGSDAPTPPADRAEESLATATWAMAMGVDMVRVHDVAPAAAAARLVGSGDRTPVAAAPA
jgi:dihydropteroate synthase